MLTRKKKNTVIIFGKGKTANKMFYYSNIELEIVHSFKYLGVTLYKNGNWHRTQKCIAEYGTYSLYKTLSNIELPVSEKFKLFDSLVGSVLCYASEVWGYCKADDIERVHTRFCRSILGVKPSTNISALYLELDRKPLIAFRQLKMLNYWAKVIRTDGPLLHSTYSMLRQDADQGNTYNNLNWAFHVKTTLDQLGFSNVWLDQDNLAGTPMPQTRQSLLDQYNQTIISSLNESQKLTLYRRF